MKFSNLYKAYYSTFIGLWIVIVVLALLFYFNIEITPYISASLFTLLYLATFTDPLNENDI